MTLNINVAMKIVLTLAWITFRTWPHLNMSLYMKIFMILVSDFTPDKISGWIFKFVNSINKVWSKHCLWLCDSLHDLAELVVKSVAQ